MVRSEELIRAVLADTRDDLKNADQKASVLLAGLGVAYGAVLSDGLPGGRPVAWWQWVVWIAWAVATLTSVASSGLAIWPRYSVPKDGDRHAVSYWGDVVGAKGVFQLASEFAEQQSDTAPDRDLRELWYLSRSAHRKYVLIRLALVSAGMSTALLVAGVLA